MPGDQDKLAVLLDRTVAGGDNGYVPGEPLTGVVRWSLDDGPVSFVVRLFWRTEGKGTADSGLADELTFEGMPGSGEQAFVFEGPSGPYSFSGELVSILWAVEAIASPGKHVARADFVLSPTGKEVKV
jgi:hypothetical protein